MMSVDVLPTASSRHKHGTKKKPYTAYESSWQRDTEQARWKAWVWRMVHALVGFSSRSAAERVVHREKSLRHLLTDQRSKNMQHQHAARGEWSLREGRYSAWVKEGSQAHHTPPTADDDSSPKHMKRSERGGFRGMSNDNEKHERNNKTWTV